MALAPLSVKLSHAWFSILILLPTTEKPGREENNRRSSLMYMESGDRRRGSVPAWCEGIQNLGVGDLLQCCTEG
jgi:hypothetical protein